MKTKLSPSNSSCLNRPSLLLCLPLCALTLVPAMFAADDTWTGGSTGLSTAWLSPTNWSTSLVPGLSDNAVFNGSSQTNTLNIDMGAAGGTQQVGSISVYNGQNNNVIIENGSTTATGTLVVNGVGGILLSNQTSTAELVIQNGNDSMNLGLANSGAIYASGTLVASSDPGRVEIYTPITDAAGPSSITLNGPGNVFFRAANTYSGDTIIQSGALELDAVGTAGDGSGTIYLSGGNIQSGASRNGYSTGGWLPNPIVVTSDAHIFNTGSTANSTRYIPFSGPVTGTSVNLIICNPTGVSGNYFVPRFSGGFTNSLSLVLGATSDPNAAFDDNTSDFSAIDLCNAPTNGVQVWEGDISGPGSLRRSSPILDNSVPGGVAILTGNNTYSGGTFIYSGTLFANNSSGSALGSGAVTVTNQGTLAGNGSVSGAVTVTGGGTLAAGINSTTIGNLNLASLTVGPGANYTWKIASSTGTAGSAWDLITCSSGWTDAGSGAAPNVIHLVSSGPPAGWNNATAYSWMLISNTPATSPGFTAANWALDTTAFGGVAAGAFSLATDANGSLDLVYTPLPNTQPVAHMVVIAPGESPALGVAPGKTGTPNPQYSTVGYSVTIEALDANYNLCSNAIDTVQLLSSSASDTLPAAAPLVNGVLTVPVVNNAVGSTVLTATNLTEGAAVATGSSTIQVDINSTTTTLSSSLNPADVGAPLALSAKVSSAAALLTGTVTFKIGSQTLGTASLSGGTAAITLTGGASTNSVTAVYNGDANNSLSTSAPLTQVIKSGGGTPPVVGVAALMQDGQDYALSNSTAITGRGPWAAGGGTGSTSYIKILAGDLSGATTPDVRPLPNQTTTPPTNPPAHLQVSKAGTNSRWYYRPMTNSVSSGSVYFSFLLNVTNTGNPTTSDEFMGSIQPSGSGTSPLPTDPLTLHARAGSDTTHYNLGIERLNGFTSWTADLADNKTYLIVLKYTFGSSSSNSLYVNPTPGGTEPAPTVSAVYDGVTAEPANLGTVTFYEAGSAVTYLTSGTYNYDVMRADNNWTTVTPSSIPFSYGPSRLAFSPGPQSLSVNQLSSLITVTLYQSNSVYNAAADTVVNLSSTSSGGAFISAVDGVTPITSVTISNGSATATFYYEDATAGSPAITGSSGLLNAASQTETITAPSGPPGFQPRSIALLANGNVSLVATGALGSTYRLWASTNLTLHPVTNTWTLLDSGTISSSPFTNFDLTATNYPQRFYLFTAP